MISLNSLSALNSRLRIPAFHSPVKGLNNRSQPESRSNENWVRNKATRKDLVIFIFNAGKYYHKYRIELLCDTSGKNRLLCDQCEVSANPGHLLNLVR